MAYLPPSAGALRERVRIERRSAAPDDMGNEVAAWAPQATGIPARIAPTKGGEGVQAGRLAGLSAFDITVRATSATNAIGPADRLVDERSGRSFNIKWAGCLDERGRFITILAEAGGAD
ncbi:head-tail adaptor protein [Brevundimonas sp. 2R-24]|uniref:Head-tail adaptor protein n=1 Tax=Peiella sedimenti TaxID=3061083 RepID=A0ABT8SQT8_9CAUL|nr:head-tail adaptor protein [Caulobacteraceae bacterium XZ-24]